jgi:hypothetical protein
MVSERFTCKLSRAGSPASDDDDIVQRLAEVPLLQRDPDH